MSEDVLKAIKDWCRGRFQAKGEYVTKTRLDESFKEKMSGAKIMKDAEGNWGLLTPDDDTVHLFFDDRAQIVGGIVLSGSKTATVSVGYNSYKGYEQITV